MLSSRLDLTYARSADRVRARLKRYEAHWGAEHFEVRHLEAVPHTTAAEMLLTYAGLRERYPDVRVDYLDLGATWDDTLLGVDKGAPGWSWSYQYCFPHLQREAREHPELRYSAAGLAHTTRHRDERETELARHGRVIDYSASGPLCLSRHLWHPRCLHNDTIPVCGERVGTAVSDEAYYLAHEFGHLAEVELWNLGYDAGEHVYSALSSIVFGRYIGPRSPYNLIHYPGRQPGCPRDRHPVGLAQQQVLKRAAREALDELMGDYARVDRAELFADAFAFCHVGTGGVRADLRELHQALREVGFRQRRPMTLVGAR